MPVPPPALSLLLDTEEPRPIHALAERNAGSYAAFHRAAHTLAGQGVLTLRREGKEVVVQAASPALPGLARSWLSRTRGAAWATIFRGDTPTTLHVLHQVGSTALAAEVMGKGRRTVQHLVQQLAPKGILVREKRGYRIHHHDALVDLLAEWDRLQAHHRLRAICPGARLMWHLGPDLLFQSPEPPAEGAVWAGLDAFSQYGVAIQTRAARTYYQGNRTLTAADALLQALLVAGYKTPTADGPSRPVQVGPEFGYACLLWEKEEPKDIWAKAELYGLHRAATDVVEYVAEKSDEWAGFLPWSEHERLRRLYGVGQ